MDTDESGLVDRINGITWTCSSEWFPFLSKIENSITIECVTPETMLKREKSINF